MQTVSEPLRRRRRALFAFRAQAERHLARSTNPDDIDHLETTGRPSIPEGATFHSIRRTYASLMFEAAADPAYGQAQIAHRSARLTLRVYTDLGARKHTAHGWLGALPRAPDPTPTTLRRRVGRLFCGPLEQRLASGPDLLVQGRAAAVADGRAAEVVLEQVREQPEASLGLAGLDVDDLAGAARAGDFVMDAMRGLAAPIPFGVPAAVRSA